MAGYGGDIWGATGGGIVANPTPAPLLQAVSYGAQKINALGIVPSTSVVAELSNGQLSIGMNTTAAGTPSTPLVGA